MNLQSYIMKYTAFCRKYKLCSVSYKMQYILSLLKQINFCKFQNFKFLLLAFGLECQFCLGWSSIIMLLHKTMSDLL
jgi:hypothetical protein